MIRKKLVYITSRFPYPLEKGDKLRAYHQIRVLSEYYDICLISISDVKISEQHKKNLAPFCKEIHIFRLWKLSILGNILIAFFKGKPLQVGYFYCYRNKLKIKKIIECYQPDTLFAQLIRVAEYVKDFSLPKTLDYQDAFSKGVARRMENASFFMKMILKIEYKRLLRYEAKMFDFFTNLTIISEQDRELIQHKDKQKICIIRNGVDFNYFHPTLNIEKEYDLLFTGNMAYPPNVEAALYIAETLLPELKKKYPSIKVLLAGATPTIKLRNLQNENVTVTGWVDDIRSCYSKSKVFIAPMFTGIGLQNKLLEAMSMSLPCITSPLANNALNAMPGKEILVASVKEEYIACILSLLENKDASNLISSNGNTFVKKYYDWHQQTAPLMNMLK